MEKLFKCLKRKPSLHLVVGNESADLDSLVSTLVAALLLDATPVMSVERADFALRTESVHHLASVGIRAEHLMFLDDAQVTDDHSLTLVDHNELSTRHSSWGPRVVRVWDHHADAGSVYPALREKRILHPLGSCSSLIASIAVEAGLEWDVQLARLLLGPILIDTGNLDPKIGKTEPLDAKMGAKLLELSQFGDGERERWFKALTDAKFNVSTLSTHDLLRKDYKSFSFEGTGEIGIAAILLPAKELTTRDDFKAEMDRWMETRGLASLMVMTAYFGEKGEFCRQLIVLGPDPLRSKLCAALEADKDFQLKCIEAIPHHKCYQQLNIKPSRKQLVPLLKALL